MKKPHICSGERFLGRLVPQQKQLVAKRSEEWAASLLDAGLAFKQGKVERVPYVAAASAPVLLPLRLPHSPTLIIETVYAGCSITVWQFTANATVAFQALRPPAFPN